MAKGKGKDPYCGAGGSNLPMSGPNRTKGPMDGKGMKKRAGMTRKGMKKKKGM